MARIFLSGDTLPINRRIYDRLVQSFGAENVLTEVDEIEWVTFDVLLVLIGALPITDSMQRAIESGLPRERCTVLPVLVDGAAMPAPDDLPESVCDLVTQPSATVRDGAHFHDDMERLIDRVRWSAVLSSPFEWVAVPGAAFEIGKYPVTNGQYRAFIEAGGYDEARWWTESGWQARDRAKWTAPRYWASDRLNGGDQPVVGVSWFEAAAFCRWLAEQTHDAVTLPDEAQWQQAAQGDDGRLYPWGGEWDAERCNNSVRPVQSTCTTPVTTYAAGASPCGAFDVAGNVWEWCLADSDAPDSAERVLKGGSWFNVREAYFHAAHCIRSRPQTRRNFIGFRVVRRG